MAGAAESRWKSTTLSSESLVLLAVAVVLAAVLLFKDLGLEGIAADEATTTARVVELLENGNWLVPSLDGEPDLHKPPLKLWVVAATIRMLGATEEALRLWDATAGLGIVLLTFVAAAHFGGALAGFVAALALATVPLFLFDHICRSNVYDSFLVLFVSAAALHHAFGSQSRRAAMLTGFFAGLALLSKGVAALPLFVILAAFEVSRSGLGGLGSSRLWIAVATAVTVASLWYVPALVLAPRVLSKEIRFEVLRRFLGERAFTHPTFFFAQLGAVFGYWLVALPPALLALRGARARGATMLIIWPVVWLAVFGVANLPQDWYGLPAFPAIAALIGIGFAYVVELMPLGGTRMRHLVAAVAVLTAFAPAYRLAYARTGSVRWTHSDLRGFADWATSVLPEGVPLFVLRGERDPPLFAQHERFDAYKLRERLRYRDTAEHLCEALVAAPAAFVILPAEATVHVPCLRTFAHVVPLRATFYSHAFPFVPKDLVARGLEAPTFFSSTEVVIDIGAGDALAGGWAREVEKRDGVFGRPMSGTRASIRFDSPPFPAPVVRVEGIVSSGGASCDPELRMNGEVLGSLSQARSETGLPLPVERLRLSGNDLEIVRTCGESLITVSRVVVRSEPTVRNGRFELAHSRQYGSGHHLVGTRIVDPDSPTGHAFVTGGTYGPPGFLYFLPIELSAGSYEATFDVRAGRLDAVDDTILVDVYAADRGRRLSAREVPASSLASDGSYLPVRLRFEIDAPRKVELRVETRDRSEIRVARVNVQSAWAEPSQSR
jgi:4-amino-4-deoxy-L-arabinose transferase-like glycosyltransferase